MSSAKKSTSPAEELMDLLQNGDNSEIRGKIFELPGESLREEQPLFLHQSECITAFEAHKKSSGVIHLPTGAGKTRVAIELMARLLLAYPNERFIWATDRLVLIRQAMVRLLELSKIFPPKTRFQWPTPLGQRQTDSGLLQRANITFVMRNDLTHMLRRAGNLTVTTSTIHDTILGKNPAGITLVCDECHFLGANALQNAWRTFARKRRNDLQKKIRVVGLSATPVPTRPASHNLLKTEIFPVNNYASARPEWPAMTHYSIDSQTLIERKILCPVNLKIQELGIFELPDDLLSKTNIAKIKNYPRDHAPSRKELGDFADEFGREVLSHNAVLKFLADRLAANLDFLGKTLVFVPTIIAANNLAHLLQTDRRVGAGKITVVHSRLNEFNDEKINDESASATEAQRQIEAFRQKGSSPCIMINVGMLTTGFDDPKIRTVFLSRLTFSENLFWQMIGRGLRGLACGGTEDCNVIDPVRLTKRFSLLDRYKPDVTKRPIEAPCAHDDANEEPEADHSADSHASIVVKAPLSANAMPKIPALMRADLRDALRAFLDGAPIKPEVVSEVCITTVVTDGKIENEFKVRDEQDPILNWYDLRVNQTEAIMKNKLRRDIDLGWIKYIFQPRFHSKLEIDYAEHLMKLIRENAVTTYEEYLTKQARQ